MGTYNGGRIVRIKLTDFLTYSSLELFPTAGLNLIIGPNGSGKSSVVCSICLGLAGKPAFTGRAVKISDYIKHGCQRAIIEIELHDPTNKKNITIRRVIKLNGTSIYMLNGETVKENYIEKEISRFNIQLNNLCQFLPQERVAEFSRMNPIKLLQSMQQAVGDQDMFEYHTALIKLREDFRNISSDVNSKQSYIEREKQANMLLENDVRLFEQQENYKKQIEILKEKKPWLMYENALKSVSAERENKRNSHADMNKQYKEGVLHQDELLKTYQYDVSDSERKISELEKNVCRYNAHAERLLAKIPEQDDKIQEARIELGNKIKIQSTQKERLLEVKKQIEALQQDYENYMQKKDQMQVQLEKNKKSRQIIQNDLAEVLAARQKFDSTLRTLHIEHQVIQNELRFLSNEEHKKMEHLLTKDRDAYEAVQWLKNHQDIFKKPIYNPILTLIDVHNEQDIKFIENHISFKDMIAFVCVDKEDSKLLIKHLREDKKLTINTVMAPNAALASYNPQFSVEILRERFGFTSYIKDLFTAPEPVMSYLCSTYNIHRTPVGNQDTEAFISDKLNNLPFNRFYTPEYVYKIKQSRYGPRNTSTTTTPLTFRGMLLCLRNGTEEQTRLEQKLQNVEIKIQEHRASDNVLIQKEQQLTEQQEKLRQFQREYTKLEDYLRMQLTNIDQKQSFLLLLENDEINVKEEKKNTAIKISKANTEKLAILRELHGILKSHCAVILEKVENCFLNSRAVKEKLKIDKRLRKETEIYRTKQARYQESTDKYRKLKNDALEFLSQAKIRSKITDSDTIPLVCERLKGLPGTIELLDEEINVIKANLACAFETDAGVVKEHENRKEDIESVEKNLESLTVRLEEINEKMKLKKMQWLTPLEILIRKISATFSKYFQRLGCAGEVILDKTENPDDFDKYGLSIRVKFRDTEPMCELSQSHHSGGECSVSTILFILSLQELTEVPFRCVDEINQGMDPSNERKVFELVTRSAEKSSQYFLLTPKLLPQLTYTPKMKIHIIHNGPCLNYLNWDLSRIVELRELSRRKEEESEQ